MARSFPSLSLGLALAGLLGAGAATAQTPANNAAEVDNPHSTDNAKRPANEVPRAETDAQVRGAEDANVHSTDNKDRAVTPGPGVSATGDAEAGSPHSVKNKDLHKRHHKKNGDAKPMAMPAPAPDNNK